MRTQTLVKKIKEKKELSSLADQLIIDTLNNYLKKHNLSLEKVSDPDSKIIVKEVRAKLRVFSGRYQKSLKDRKKFLNDNSLQELLKTHSSTAERLEFYPTLKKIIKELKVNSILDLGCGLNPIALASPEIKYNASDIKQDELSLIKLFFKKNQIKGNVFIYDLKRIKEDLPKSDLCLLFKVLDILEEKEHKIAEEIIKKTPCKKILVSFATKKLSGKPMSQPRRFWFEKMLTRLNLKFEKFSSRNEIFYLIEK